MIRHQVIGRLAAGNYARGVPSYQNAYFYGLPALEKKFSFHCKYTIHKITTYEIPNAKYNNSYDDKQAWIGDAILLKPRKQGLISLSQAGGGGDGGSGRLAFWRADSNVALYGTHTMTALIVGESYFVYIMPDAGR